MQVRKALLAALALAAFGSAPSEAGPKKYFLTVEGVPGNQALDACGKGYHMASLWEVLEVTALKYDAKRGETRSDSGEGPPAGGLGWIRTGGSNAVLNSAGAANCATWTSSSASDYGSVAGLNDNWGDPALVSNPWSTETLTCNLIAPVWCKQN